MMPLPPPLIGGRVLCQSAVHRACTGSNIRCFSQGSNPFGLYYPSSVRKVAGNVRCISVASSSLAQDVVNDSLRPSFVPKDVVLYQYEACPFCNKVEAFLDYYNVPYKVVEVNPVFKKEIKWSEYKKVPILMVDGVQMVLQIYLISYTKEFILRTLPRSQKKRGSGLGGWIITWCMFYRQTYTEITKRLLSLSIT